MSSFRRTTRTLVTTAALALLVPAALHAQGRAGGGMGGQGGPGGGAMIENLVISPAGLAIENAEALELTAEQTPRLQALHTAYEEKNAEHLTLIRSRLEAMQAAEEARQGTARQGAARQGAARQGGQQGGQGQRAGGMGAGAAGENMAAMQEAMQALRAARQEQATELAAILTPGQLQSLRALMMPRRPDGQRRPDGAR